MIIGLSKKGFHMLRNSVNTSIFDNLPTIKYQPISEPGRKSDKVRLGPMVVPFYLFILLYQRTPTPEEFFRQYQLCYDRDLYNLESGSKAKEEDIRPRVYRAYPSLIRDIHFWAIASEDSRFDDVKYSTEMDYHHGVDLIIKKAGFEFAVTLHRASESAANWAKGKVVVGRFKAIINIVLDNPDRVGDFDLYTKQSLDYLAAAIDLEIGKKE